MFEQLRMPVPREESREGLRTLEGLGKGPRRPGARLPRSELQGPVEL
jgi:hypothetical protein